MNEATKQFVLQHAHKPPHQVALIASKHPNVNITEAINQIRGKQIASEKIPLWADNPHIQYPPHLSLEQCSSQTTAQFKASLTQGNTLIDLTGGLGVDCAFLAEKFQKVTYIEQQENLASLAQNNFRALKLHHIEVIHSQCEDYLRHLSERADTIFIDPARRNGQGKKVVLLEECNPNIEKLLPTLIRKAKRVMVKLSPMLDINALQKALPNIADIYIVSVQNEVKEILTLHHPSEDNTSPKIHCVNLLKNGKKHTYTGALSTEATLHIDYATQTKEYLYEPFATILKAGLYKSIATDFLIEKLHPNSHLYTSQKRINNFPGRVFEITHVFSLCKADIKQIRKMAPEANIAVRNFPLKTEELRKRLKLKDGGDKYLFATTLSNNRKVIIATRKITPCKLDTDSDSILPK